MLPTLKYQPNMDSVFALSYLICIGNQLLPSSPVFALMAMLNIHPLPLNTHTTNQINIPTASTASHLPEVQLLPCPQPIRKPGTTIPTSSELLWCKKTPHNSYKRAHHPEHLLLLTPDTKLPTVH